MDVGAVAIGGVSLVFLVPGLVEFAKKLGVRGKWCVVLAFCLAALFGGTWAAIDAGLIKPDERVGKSRKLARYLPAWA